MTTRIAFSLNGAEVAVEVTGAELLLDVLRRRLRLTGTKEGCGRGECGACTVLVDGLPVNACLFPAREAEGRQVTTIEGLVGEGGLLGPVQQAFVERGGIQCGFCSPGMILSAHALIERRARPSAEEIRDALAGNLCRCTGYVQVVESVQRAAELRAPDAGGAEP